MLLDDDRVHISLEPYDTNPLVLAMEIGKRDVIPTLLEHPKIKVEWIDNILSYFLENFRGAYGLEIIRRKYKHLITNKALLDRIPEALFGIKEQVDEYTYYYEPDYWSDDDDNNNDQ